MESPLYIFTGKGCAGRSTFAASLSILLARQGRRVIAVELFPLLGKTSVSRIVSTQPPSIRKRITSIALHAERVAKEYVLRKVKVEILASILARTELFRYILSAAPGLKELLCLGKIWQLCKDGKRMGYEAVIWDAPPFERLMELINIPLLAAESTKGSPVYREALKIVSLLKDRSRIRLFYIMGNEDSMLIENTITVPSNNMGLNLTPGIIIINKWEKGSEAECSNSPDSTITFNHRKVPVYRVPYFYKTSRDIPLMIIEELERCLKRIT